MTAVPASFSCQGGFAAGAVVLIYKGTMPSAIENNDETAHLSWRVQLARLMRSARKHRNMTLVQLAREIDKSPRQLYRVESAQCDPPAYVVDKWFRACGVELHVELWSKW